MYLHDDVLAKLLTDIYNYYDKECAVSRNNNVRQ